MRKWLKNNVSNLQSPNNKSYNQKKKAETTINSLRYSKFSKGVTNKKAKSLASLPPTEDAAEQHLFRTSLQVQQWMSNDLSPVEWGWKLENKLLRPVQMTQNAAPDTLLKVIFCNCKKPCGKACSCKKAGLFCTSVCGFCNENNCENTQTVDLDENSREDYAVTNSKTEIDQNNATNSNCETDSDNE